MKLIDAVNILERHNKWRRGADIEQENPVKIGVAIQTVLKAVKVKVKKENI